jgi:hypothetical protein
MRMRRGSGNVTVHTALPLQYFSAEISLRSKAGEISKISDIQMSLSVPILADTSNREQTDLWLPVWRQACSDHNFFTARKRLQASRRMLAPHMRDLVSHGALSVLAKKLLEAAEDQSETETTTIQIKRQHLARIVRTCREDQVEVDGKWVDYF